MVLNYAIPHCAIYCNSFFFNCSERSTTEKTLIKRYVQIQVSWKKSQRLPSVGLPLINVITGVKGCMGAHLAKCNYSTFFQVSYFITSKLFMNYLRFNVQLINEIICIQFDLFVLGSTRSIYVIRSQSIILSYRINTS